MGRATSGVIGMRFRAGDELLAMDAVRPGADLVTFTDGGFWKRTSLDEWTPKGRGGIGVVAMKLPEHRGVLVGALVVVEGDEVLAMTAGGGVIRTTVTETELQRRGRDTMGVRLIALKDGDAVVGVARNAEAEDEDDEAEDADAPEVSTARRETATWGMLDLSSPLGALFLTGTTSPTGATTRGPNGDERSHGGWGRRHPRCPSCVPARRTQRGAGSSSCAGHAGRAHRSAGRGSG